MDKELEKLKQLVHLKEHIGSRRGAPCSLKLNSVNNFHTFSCYVSLWSPKEKKLVEQIMEKCVNDINKFDAKLQEDEEKEKRNKIYELEKELGIKK